MKKHRQPTEEDLYIWNQINRDLLDWLYTGITGKFQIKGHQVIRKWSEPMDNETVLEIGCGHGHHLKFSHPKYKKYIGLDINNEFLKELSARDPGTPLIQSDVYRTPIKSGSMRTVISIYNLEHLKDLDGCLKEIDRILCDDGKFLIALPSEGGFIYNLGRNLTSKPYLEKKYGIDYDAIVHYEHCNGYKEILSKVREIFHVEQTKFVPFSIVPSYHFNPIICLDARKKKLVL